MDSCYENANNASNQFEDIFRRRQKVQTETPLFIFLDVLGDRETKPKKRQYNTNRIDGWGGGQIKDKTLIGLNC